jgi:hypothetical protein
MSITWTNEGAESAMRLSFGSTPTWTHLYLRLATAAYTPTHTDTWAGNPYTELGGSYYTPLDILTLGPSLTASAGVATYTFTAQTMALAYPGSATTIYDYFLEVTASSGGPWLLGGEILASSYAIPSSGGSLIVTPNWTNGGQ